MEAEKTGSEPPARHVNGRMWQPGQSGNVLGRPVGARGRFSERFVADLTTAWEQYGETALAETAKLYPDRFVAIASHLIPKDVSVSLTARLPANLDATDWQSSSRCSRPSSRHCLMLGSVHLVPCWSSSRGQSGWRMRRQLRAEGVRLCYTSV
jgi:hypothetical protein